MNQAPSKSPSNSPDKAAPMLDEADIGSGETSPAQQETDEMIRQIPTPPEQRRPPPTEQPEQPAIVSPS